MSDPDYIQWLRAHVGHTKVILAYASAIVIDEKGHILLQHRSDFSWWGLPGGILERGERLEDCLVREVHEETGLHVVPDKLIGIYSSPDFDVTYPNGDLVQQFTVCFACRATGGNLRPDGEEILELATFPPDQLPDVPSWYRAMIKDFGAGQEEASFRQGRSGQAVSGNHLLSLRQSVGTAPLITVAAAAHVQDKAGRILLVRRGDTGIWSVVGGAAELGERIDQTLIREVREEIGLIVEPERLIGVYSGPDLFHTYPNGDQIYVVSAFFASRIVGGNLQPDGSEIVEARFFPPDDLPPLPSRFHTRISDALAGKKAAAWR